MQLIENWKSAWKMFSVQAQVAAGSLLGTWSVVPEDLKTHIPQQVVLGIAMGLLVLGTLGRIIKQDGIEK